MRGMLKSGILSGNALKIIALISMTIDHIGVQIFPFCDMFRIIGRFAFPIFAYMIAEGCTYTKNRAKYLLAIGVVAIVCQSVYFFVMGSLYQCIFVTFFLSIVMIYTADYVLKNKTLLSTALFWFLLCSVIFVTEYLPYVLVNTDFYIDYGLIGVMLPFSVYYAKGREMRLVATMICLVVLACLSGTVQWYSLLALPLIAIYNGKRGKYKLKWFFYIYYPAHLVAIYFVSCCV